MREKGDLEVRKVPGTNNPADQLTKYLGGGEVDKGLRMLGMEERDGRAQESIKVKGKGGG